ncbi:MAG: ATP-binding protein [Deltaproteobacteria bacterium]|nr:ATP-binding protein [Deltaproteobacteria bacterium]
MNGAELITCIRSIGGTAEPGLPFFGWILAIRNGGRTEPIVAHAPELVEEGVHIDDFHGMVTLTLNGQQYLALRVNEQVFPGQVERALLLAGSSLATTLGLAALLKAKRAELFREQVVVYGADAKPTGLTPVAEADVILPDQFKVDLLAYLDRFWRGAELCAKLRIAPTRGVLFVGAPGTGKTLMVRHLLHRYPDCRRFLFLVEGSSAARALESPFRAMVQEIEATDAPAIVVLEDVDRLLDSGVVTAEFFLNVLDGMFQPSKPVLWIATSNDPTKLELNLLDRPGRFDRVFVFPGPGQAERIGLLQRYSPWPLYAGELTEIGLQCEGLTGAHLREACFAAAVSVAEDPARYVGILREEVRRVMRQHEQVRSLDSNVGKRQAGFVKVCLSPESTIQRPGPKS